VEPTLQKLEPTFQKVEPHLLNVEPHFPIFIRSFVNVEL